jgi:hypothetical protein
MLPELYCAALWPAKCCIDFCFSCKSLTAPLHCHSSSCGAIYMPLACIASTAYLGHDVAACLDHILNLLLLRAFPSSAASYLQGAPPSAPDIHARPEDTTSSGLYTPTNPTAPTAPTAATPGGYYSQQQQQQYEKPWEQHVPGTLSNPYTTAAPAPPSHHYPFIPTAADNDSYGYGSSSSKPQDSRRPHVKYAEVPGGYKDVSPSGPGGYSTGGGGYNTGDYGSAKPWGESGAVASELERQLQDEARQARLEWEAEQREVERQRQQAATRSPRDDDDGGWGGRDQGRQRQQQKEKQAPDWLDLLGKVFGGGPAYGVAAPDL